METTRTDASDAPLFGREEALNMIGGDEDLLNDVAAIASQEIPKQLAALHSALSSSDSQTARRHAHTLKGTVATLGANEVRDVAMQVEHAARDGDLSGAAAGYDKLQVLSARLVTELSGFLGSNRA